MAEMASEELEYDSKEGLMEEIERITAPPQSDDIKKVKKPQERIYYRKPGKPHNHDYCDSCGEGGDLLCCDRCPCSFHLECNDPPIDEDDFPMGEWLCHKCQTRPIIPEPMDNDDAASTCSSKSRSSDTAGTSSCGINVRSSSKPSSQRPSPVPMVADSELMAECDPEELARRPLAVLAKVASRLNPKQFQLPKDLVCPIQFPGDSRKTTWRSGNGNRSRQSEANNRGNVVEMENNMVPLPAKLCFNCERSCRRGALIQCDYCPCLFHLDCLDPPLTAVPQTLWMCPNHPQHYVDSTMLKSLRVTERIKLWNEFTAPVDGHSVKVNFLKKLQRKDPPFLYKVPRKRKRLMKVPHAIKCQYEYPRPLLPAPPTYEKPPGQYAADPKDQEQWLSAIMHFHAEMARELAAIEASVNQTAAMTTASSSTERSVSPSPGSINAGKPTASIAPRQKLSDSCQDMDVDDSQSQGSLAADDQAADKPRLSPVENGNVVSVQDLVRGDGDRVQKLNSGLPRDYKSLSNSHPPGEADQDNVRVNGSLEDDRWSSTASEEQAMSRDHSCRCSSVKSSASQEFSAASVADQEMEVDGEAKEKTPTPEDEQEETSETSETENLQIDTNVVHDMIKSNKDMDLNKLDPHIIRFLAMQQLKTILGTSSDTKPPAKPAAVTTTVASRPSTSENVISMATPNSSESTLSTSFQTPDGSQLRARAMLCPIKGNGEPVAMVYRNLTIGTGGQMAVNLNKFGHCNYASSLHASIFYDQVTGEFELLNYSCHGTVVDGVLYSCDLTDRPFQPSNTPTPTSLVSSVRRINKKGRSKKTKGFEKNHDTDKIKLEPSDYMTSTPYEKPKCGCVASPAVIIGSKGAGWEGSALLHHGSIIHCGCLQFAFSIVDSNPLPPLSSKTEAKSEDSSVHVRRNLSNFTSHISCG